MQPFKGFFVKAKTFVLIFSLSTTMVAFQNCAPTDRFGQSSEDQSSNSVATHQACTFNGQPVENGLSVSAFLNSTVPFGSTCISQQRTCLGSSLSGSYLYGACTPGTPTACLFNGQTISHGGSVTASQNSTVSIGSSCVDETRVCDNGKLSGSYAFGSCAVGTPASCLYNGQTMVDGAGVDAYLNSTVNFGSVCDKETRICKNGTLSGSFAYGSCVVGAPASCLFNGQTITHGSSVIASQSSTVAFGSACISENRICTNGELSGSYEYGSCNVGAAASCIFNGQTVAHGASIDASEKSTIPSGSSCSHETRTCDNGMLSGSFEYGSCNVAAPASCLVDGQQVSSGSSIIRYLSASVGYRQNCKSESRLCSDGILAGKNTFPSCVPTKPTCPIVVAANGNLKTYGTARYLSSNGEFYVNDGKTLEKVYSYAYPDKVSDFVGGFTPVLSTGWKLIAVGDDGNIYNNDSKGWAKIPISNDSQYNIYGLTVFTSKFSGHFVDFDSTDTYNSLALDSFGNLLSLRKNYDNSLSIGGSIPSAKNNKIIKISKSYYDGARVMGLGEDMNIYVINLVEVEKGWLPYASPKLKIKLHDMSAARTGEDLVLTGIYNGYAYRLINGEWAEDRIDKLPCN